MANLPQSISMSGGSFGAPSVSATKDRRMASVEHLVLELSNPDLRENALHELSKVCSIDFSIPISSVSPVFSLQLFQPLQTPRSLGILFFFSSKYDVSLCSYAKH